MKRFGIIFLLCTLGGAPCMGRTSIAVFPIAQNSGTLLDKWIGPAVVERLSSNFRQMPQTQVWESTFLFSADTTVSSIVSDSLLNIHQKRWEWDYAIGGDCVAAGDSVFLTIQVVSGPGPRMTRQRILVKGSRARLPMLIAAICWKIAPSIGIRLSQDDSLDCAKLPSSSLQSFALYAAGYGFELDRRYSEAFAAYFHAIEIDPQMGCALNRIGQLYSAARQPEEALRYLNAAMAANASNPDFVADYAQVLISAGAPVILQQFITAHREVLTQSAEGYLALARAYMVSGEYQRSLAMCTRAINEGPRNLETDYTLGGAYFAAGQFDQACGVFNRLIRYRPGYIPYYTYLGSAYRQSGRIMESVSILRTALKLDSKNVSLLISLAHTYFEVGWKKNAELLLLFAKEIAPANPLIDVNLATIYWNMGRREDAERIFSRYSQELICQQTVFNNLGNGAFMRGNPQDALQLYKKAELAGAQNTAVLYNMALAYLSLQKYELASGVLDRILQSAPTKLDVLTKQAFVSHLLKNSDREEQTVRSILELSPYDKQSRLQLLDLMEAQKRFPEMVEQCEQFLENSPNDRQIRLLLSQTYIKMEWYEVAIMKYEMYIRDFPADVAGYIGVATGIDGLWKTKRVDKREDALRYLQTAKTIAPVDPLPYMMLGELYAFYKKDKASAGALWQRALELSTDPAQKVRIESFLAGGGPQ